MEWAEENINFLRNYQPNLPDSLSDRQQEAVEPLLAIADIGGGDWPVTSRNALVEILGATESQDQSIGVKLLADIRSIFVARKLSTCTDLLTFLTSLVEEVSEIAGYITQWSATRREEQILNMRTKRERTCQISPTKS